MSPTWIILLLTLVQPLSLSASFLFFVKSSIIHLWYISCLLCLFSMFLLLINKKVMCPDSS